MVNINKYIKALSHPAGGHQGSHKAHQAGNQSYVLIIYAILCIDMLFIRLAPCHYLNQCCQTIAWTNFSELHVKILTYFFYSRKAFGNVMCKTTSILSQQKCVRLLKSQMLCEHPTLSITKMNIDMLHPSMKMLTHLPPDKIASISQTIFFKCISMNEKLRLIIIVYFPKNYSWYSHYKYNKYETYITCTS